MDEKDINPSSIRTFAGDVASAVQNKQTSQVDMVLANEEKRRRENQENNVLTLNPDEKTAGSSKLKRNILMTAISLILLGGGVWAVYYFYEISPLSVKQPTDVQTATNAVPSSFITPDKQKIIDLTGLGPQQIITAIQGQAAANRVGSGNILEMVPTEQGTTTANGKMTTGLVRLTAAQFISSLNIVPPNALTSTLTNSWMLGFYTSSDQITGTTTTPFIILGENFFQNAFAGMLKWEPTMAPDVSNLFGISGAEWSQGKFEDKLVNNKNVREFVDNDGNVLFLYSFIDNNTLVIAQNEEALGEIITRFESKQYVR